MTNDLPECEQFPGRLNELCNGTALIDGIPMTQEQITFWRSEFGLPPIGVPKEEWEEKMRSLGIDPSFARLANWKDGSESHASLDDLPPLMIRGWNFALAMARWTLAGMPLRSQAEIDDRLVICQSCPQLVNDVCQKCGCRCQGQLINKLSLKTESCPLGKWN